MKAGYFALAVLTPLTLTLSPLGPFGAAEAGALHSGTGTLLSVEGGRLMMTEEPRGTHILALNYETTIVDATGSPLAAASLQPGDLVREECLAAGDGTFTAKQIRLLRPAWRELASPEM